MVISHKTFTNDIYDHYFNKLSRRLLLGHTYASGLGLFGEPYFCICNMKTLSVVAEKWVFFPFC